MGRVGLSPTQYSFFVFDLGFLRLRSRRQTLCIRRRGIGLSAICVHAPVCVSIVDALGEN